MSDKLECNCPADYHGLYIDADGKVAVERHNRWCPLAHDYFLAKPEAAPTPEGE